MGLGLWIGRRVRGTGDFFVAGRRLGPGLLFSTMLAANIGAGSTVNAAALGYADGLSAWWWIGSAGIGSIVLAWLVVTVYFTAGGLLTSAWVNVVQLAVLLGGFVVVVPLALTGVGGWESVVAATSDLDDYWNPWQGGGSGWFYLAMLGPAFIVSPGLLQKVYGARDDRTVRIGVTANGVVLLLFAAVPPLLGMMMRTLNPDLANHDLALPTLFVEALPPAVGAVGLAALFSAEVSSADAILFMLATAMSQDVYRRFVRPAANDADVLRAARLAAITGGVLATALAVVAETIVAALGFFYTVISVSLFVPVIAGLYVRRFEVPEALTAVAAGVSIGVVTQVSTAGVGVGGLTPAMLGLGAAALSSGAVAVARKRLVGVT